jgi:membrane-associated phospholipid phosphatase
VPTKWFPLQCAIRQQTVAIALSALCTLSAKPAKAEIPSRLKWNPSWPRVSTAEVINVVGLTFASYAISTYWEPPRQPAWRGGILFDNWMRDALRGRSYSVQSNAADISDFLFKAGVLAPILVDVWLVGLGVHQDADVSLQMLLIDAQSLAIAGVVSLTAEHAVGRARPYTGDCSREGKVLNASGQLLFNSCDNNDQNFQSFYSGHSAAVATMAGLTCVHHQHLPLYGGGFADLVPCLLMMGTAVGTGVTRVIADKHWASDVVAGWGVGAFSGYVLPSLLHYGFGNGRAAGEVSIGGAHAVPVLQAYRGGVGIGVVGMLP